MSDGSDLALGYMMGNSDNGGSRNDGGMFGGDGNWIFAFLIIALIFGDRLGLNGNGNNGGSGNCCNNGGVNTMPVFLPSYGMGGFSASSADTRAAVADGFALNNLQSGINGLNNGLCDGFYALNTGMLNGFNGVNTTLMQGFHGVDNAVCNLGYQTQAGFNALGTQMASCCCETQRQVERGFCDTNYNLATNTTAIIQNAHNDTDRVIAKLDAMEMSRKDETIAALRSQVEALNLSASQANQNAAIGAMIDASRAEILRRTGSDCPVAAYVVPNPNCCYGNPVGVNYGYPYGQNGCNSGCSGCGC